MAFRIQMIICAIIIGLLPRSSHALSPVKSLSANLSPEDKIAPRSHSIIKLEKAELICDVSLKSAPEKFHWYMKLLPVYPKELLKFFSLR